MCTNSGNQQFNSLVFSLNKISKGLSKPVIPNHVDNIRHSRIDMRNFVSQLIIAPQRRYVHECSEILHGLHKTTISDTNVDRD